MPGLLVNSLGILSVVLALADGAFFQREQILTKWR